MHRTRKIYLSAGATVQGGGGGGFSPLSLSPTAWYDPSDLSTLWQDSARTTPVTADSDVVGCIDDKSGNGHHLTQDTTANKPLYKTSGGLHWMSADGVDDTLAKASVNFSATDKITMCIGLRIPSDAAATNYIVNHGSAPYFNVGRQISTSNKYQAVYRGSGTVTAASASGYAAVDVAVITVTYDKAAPAVIGRRNGVQILTSVASPGTGNFANATLTVFAANVAADIATLVIYPSVLSAENIALLEAWTAAKTGVTL